MVEIFFVCLSKLSAPFRKQKFSVSDCRKRGLKMPKGLTTHDDLCADCFDGLSVR